MADYPTIGDDTLLGTAGADNIDGLAGDDTITGLAGNDTLTGGTGNDVFIIGGTDFGYDIYNGGDGADMIRLNSSVVVSSLQLTSANVIGTETLALYGYSISGTGGNDSFDISGMTNVTSYRLFEMGDGADRFVGFAGDDYDDGGSGNDTINGRAGDDTIIGGAGNDYLIGDTGNDVFIIGGTDFGLDTYNGGVGADMVRLNANVTVSTLRLTAAALSGTETLSMYGYSISGTGGNDNFDISGITNVTSYRWIEMGDGADRFKGHVGDDFINGGSGNDTINTGAGDDSILGGAGNDYLLGGTGNDVFLIGGTDFGLDVYNGGLGADTIRLNADVTVSTLRLTVNAVSGTETLSMYGYSISGTGANDNFDISGITNVTSYRWIDMGDGLDRFVGHIGSDYINGGSGKDTMNAGAGDDELIGGAGNDYMIGGSGNDTFYIGGTDFGRDIYHGGDGADIIRLTSDVTLSRLLLTASNVIQTETLSMYGYEISGTGANDIFDISGMTNVTSYRLIDMEDGADRFVGHVGGDYVSGGSGSDTINGRAGDDTLYGSSGNDFLFGETGNDYLDGGDGIDTVSYASASSGVRVNLQLTSGQSIGGGHGTDTLAGVENITGSRFGDAITGNNLGNRLLGDAGNDQLLGLGGNDQIFGGTGNDVLHGGAGNDVLNGQAGSDTASYSGASVGGVTVDLRLTGAQAVGGGQGSDQLLGIENLLGSSYGDRMVGSNLNNVLNGGDGNDRITALGGNDVLIGGGGNDNLAGGDGNDRLNGGIGSDVLAGGLGADSFLFGVGYGSDRVTDWQNGSDRFEITAGTWQGVVYDSYDDLRISQTASGAQIWLGGTAITLSGVSAGLLDASDFVFV